MIKNNIYCKYCGSNDIQIVKYEVKQNVSSSFSTNINILKFTHNNSKDKGMFYETYFCKTCGNINCNTLNKPIEFAKLKYNNMICIIIFPEAILNILKTINAMDSEIKKFIYNLGESMKKPINYFIKNGKNPCKKGKIGFRRNIKIQGQLLQIRIVMDNKPNNINQIYARIVYDGGNSICP